LIFQNLIAVECRVMVGVDSDDFSDLVKRERSSGEWQSL
jgi:hypothetical protein